MAAEICTQDQLIFSYTRNRLVDLVHIGIKLMFVIVCSAHGSYDALVSHKCIYYILYLLYVVHIYNANMKNGSIRLFAQHKPPSIEIL